jgi:hypothetical protein
MGDDLKVWASGPFSPVVVCEDARTPDPSREGYPGGTSQGQFGWDVGLGFGNTADLADKLTKLVSSSGKKVERLAVVVRSQAFSWDALGPCFVANSSTTRHKEVKRMSIHASLVRRPR